MNCIRFDHRLACLCSLTIAFLAHPTIRKLIQIAPCPSRGAVGFRLRSPESSKAELGFRSDAVDTGVRNHRTHSAGEVSTRFCYIRSEVRSLGTLFSPKTEQTTRPTNGSS